MAERLILALSGPPASGKDTVTACLAESDPRFVAFKKHRSINSGEREKDTYVNITPEEFHRKADAGDFLQWHMRYGRGYGIEETALLDCCDKGRIPVIHVGRIENYFELDRALHRIGGCKLVHVLLYETAGVLAKRIIARDKRHDEVERRIAAMDQEFTDNLELFDRGVRPYDFIVRNENAEVTCKIIADGLTHAPIDDGYAGYYDYLSSMGRDGI